MDIMEIKNKTTKELKDFSKRIDEEIKFREEVGREIDKKEELTYAQLIKRRIIMFSTNEKKIACLQLIKKKN